MTYENKIPDNKSKPQADARIVKRQHKVGILATTFGSLLSVPLYAVLIVYALHGLGSHLATSSTNEIWGCSQYKADCVGPQYSQTLTALVIMVAIPIAISLVGQRIAKFPRPKRAIVLLTLYSGLVIILSMTFAFVSLLGL
jgi:hypothetical protein